MSSFMLVVNKFGILYGCQHVQLCKMVSCGHYITITNCGHNITNCYMQPFRTS